MTWKGNFRLTAATQLCPHVVIDARRCFYVQNRKRRLYMEADSDNERELWLQVLRQSLAQLQH